MLLKRFHISHTLSHISYISHIFLQLSCTLLTHSRSYNLSCSHFVISHAPLYVSLSHKFLTHPHTSHALSHFPRALTSDHACFLRLSRAQSQRYWELEKMLSTEATCITDPNIVTIYSGWGTSCFTDPMDATRGLAAGKVYSGVGHLLIRRPLVGNLHPCITAVLRIYKWRSCGIH